MQYFDFQGHQLSRVFKGNWQLSGGHGSIERDQAIQDLVVFAEHGINTFDAGDIYTGAEEILGEFLKQYRFKKGKAAANKLRIHTKFVPDLNALEDLTKQDVRVIIERSLKRLKLDSLHLVQFHWWDFAKGDFVQAALYLDELRSEGLVESIAVTNMDVFHVQQLLAAGIDVSANQIQFSLLDPRPLNGMLEFADKHGIAIFCYGVLAGGLLASAQPSYEKTNRSHIKYKLMIDEVGEAYYKDLLQHISKLAEKYQTNPANISTQFVLQTPGVSAAILGPRNTRHLGDLDELDRFTLTSNEYKNLAQSMQDLKITDDIYSYERDMNGPHGRIMKYNLNNMRPEKAV